MNLPTILLLALTLPAAHAADSCLSQSRIPPATRDPLAAAATTLALEIAANNSTAIRAAAIPDLQADFPSVAALIAQTAPHLTPGTPQLEQLYLLDASTNPTNQDTQFYCTLNASTAEADFTIPQLPPGLYAFAMLAFDTPANPYRLSMLLRQESGAWHLAGLYPKPLTAQVSGVSHDGLYFWTQSRALAKESYPWSAWLYLQQAQSLLIPAPFVSSTHLEKLAAELSTATPPAAANISAESPLVLKAPSGTEFRLTALSVTDTLGPDKLDIAEHLKVDALGDPALARQRNLDAAQALLAAHPELRKFFHGVLVSAEAPKTPPYATELAMSEIH